MDVKSMRTIRPILAVVLIAILPAGAQDTQTSPPVMGKDASVDSCEFGPEAQDSDSGPPIIIQVQLEHVELSHEELTKLLFLSSPETTDAGPLRKKIQELVNAKEAKVLETQIIAGRSTQKSSANSVHELIHPTEYEPQSGITKSSEKQKDGDDPLFNRYSFPYNPATPTAFDTRNVGSNLEVEPTASEDGKYIDVRIVSELMWHTGNTTWQEHKDERGNVSSVRMPNIYTVTINTNVCCINGQYTLLAVQSPKGPEGEVDMSRKIITFLKCNVLLVK